MIRMENGNRVVWGAVLEHDYKTTVATAPGIAFVRFLPIVQQAITIILSEVQAPLREDIVGFSKFIPWDSGQGSFMRNSLPRRPRCGNKDQIHPSNPCQQRTKRGDRVIPCFADLLSGAAEVIKKNYNVIHPKPIRIALWEHGLTKQIAPRNEELVELLAV
jgi:hypothetical protein